MKNLKVLALVGLLLVALPALAQKGPFDVTVWASVLHSSRATAADSQGTEVHFADGAGCGLSVDVPILRFLSVEVGGSELNPFGAIRYRGQQILDLGRLKTYAVTGLVDLHPFGRDGDVDIHIGVGGAWASFSDLSSPDLDTTGAGTVEVKSATGFAAGAGIRAALSKSIGVALDVKYLHLRPESKGTQGAPLELELDPFVASVGLSWRF